MKWEFFFNEKENVLSVKTYGIYDLTTKMELMKECLAVIEKKNCRQCLIDNSEIKSTRIEFMEIYSMPEKFTKLGMPRNLRIAEVYSAKHKKDFNFLEVICHNNGYWLSVFSDVESALRWLKQ
jgi:hypothetical protein